MTNLNYVVGAYTAVWVGFFLYTFSLHRRQNRLMKEIGVLKERVGKKLKKCC